MQPVDLSFSDVASHLAVNGSKVELVDVTDEMIVKIKWLGACEGCSMTTMTMRAGIEQAIIGKMPEITGVEAINGVEVE